MKSEIVRIIRTYFYNGQVIAMDVKRGKEATFEPSLGLEETEKIIEELPIVQKADLSKNKGLYKLAEHYNIDPEDYLSDNEIITYIIDRKLNNKPTSKAVQSIVARRGLEEKITEAIERDDIQETYENDEEYPLYW